jgi:prepilin-type N-terminal cleavage/methylation domain-containing protein
LTRLDRIRRRLREERGFTLIELMVSASVGVVLVGAAFGMLDAVVRTFGISGDRVDGSQRGRMAMDSITKKLRSQVCGGTTLSTFVPSFTSATKDRVTFWSDIGDGSGKRVRGLELASGTISELDAPNAATTPTKRELVANVAANNGSGASAGLFRFYAYNPAAANQATTPAPPLYIELTGAPNLTAADLKRIVRVTVAFTAVPRGGTQADKLASDFTGDFLSRTAASPYELSDVPTDPAVLEPRCK